MNEKLEPVEVSCPLCDHTQIIYLPKEKLPVCPVCEVEMVLKEEADETKTGRV